MKYYLLAFVILMFSCGTIFEINTVDALKSTDKAEGVGHYTADIFGMWNTASWSGPHKVRTFFA